MADVELKWTSVKVEAKCHPLKLTGPKFTFPKLWMLEAVIRGVIRRPVPRIPYGFSADTELETHYSKGAYEDLFGKITWYQQIRMTTMRYLRWPFFWINGKIDAWKMSFTNMKPL